MINHIYQQLIRRYTKRICDCSESVYPWYLSASFDDADMCRTDVNESGKIFLRHILSLSCSFNPLSNCLYIHRITPFFRT